MNSVGSNIEALKAVIMVDLDNDQTLTKVLVDADISPLATYTKENAKAIDLCAIEVLSGMLAMADVSEGDYSRKFDRKAIQVRLGLLTSKHNPTAGKPNLRAVNVW